MCIQVHTYTGIHAEFLPMHGDAHAYFASLATYPGFHAGFLPVHGHAYAYFASLADRWSNPYYGMLRK